MNIGRATRDGFEKVRQEIFDHVDNDDDFERPRLVRLQLNRHRDPAWEPEWLEAFTLLNCVQRIAPSRTHGALARLRNMRIKSGEKGQFDCFMDKVTAILSPDFITPHGYNKTFSTLNSDLIFNSMGNIAAPLAKLGCPLFLYAGALLGHQRSGELIGHDDDIDIGVFLGECDAASAPQLWSAYKGKLAKAGLLDDTEIKADKLNFKLKNDLPVDVDLFPSWTCQGKFSVYPYSFNDIPSQTIFPLKSFGQDPLMLPASPEALLDQSYGKDWLIPDPLFHLNWPEKKKIFHVLADFDFSM